MFSIHQMHPSKIITSQIAKFMGPTWGPPGSCRPQMGPMLAPMNLAIWDPTKILTLLVLRLGPHFNIRDVLLQDLVKSRSCEIGGFNYHITLKFSRHSCSSYIFILVLTPGFNGMGNDNCKTRREIFKNRCDVSFSYRMDHRAYFSWCEYHW